jgi:predicted RNA-binding protein with PUA-like domain
MKSYWIFKSEPDEFSIDDLRSKKLAPWDGVRNYQVRNSMRDHMKVGDLAYFYHSSCSEIGIAGAMTIASLPYMDPLAADQTSEYFDPKAVKSNPWLAINVQFAEKYKKILTLKEIQSQSQHSPALQSLLILKKGNRLSITHISKEQWDALGVFVIR